MNEKIKSITDSYFLILKDFFEIVSKNSDFFTDTLCIGINTINRVFEYTIIKTKSIEKAKFYSQRSYYYYLEYVEQIKDLAIANDLNNMDAVLFSYKKTIFDLSNDETSQSLNMLTINNDPIIIQDEELKNILKQLFKLTNTLFYWENEKINFAHRYRICNIYLFNFFKKLDVAVQIYSYLEIMQHKISMDFNEYELLLKEYINKKIKSAPDIESGFIKFYVEETLCIEKFRSGNMKDFLNWVYSPI
jgi:hypothetical protein